mgnify:CR=1 FL=1
MVQNIAVIDNYDSFTFNLVHALEPYVNEVYVMRNDAIDWDQLSSSHGILLSPGPGLPQNAGQMPAVLEEFAGQKSILGVCLGMQALQIHFSGELENMEEVLHGRKFEIDVKPDSVLFRDFPVKTSVGLYHSWCCRADQIPSGFTVTALHQDIPMAFENKAAGLFGIQFHPESIMTPAGITLLVNWLKSIETAKLKGAPALW